MTDKKSRRVLIINNIQSETIDQAIFILKSDRRSSKPNPGIAGEAQRIINDYINRVEQNKSTSINHSVSTKKTVPMWLKLSLLTLTVASLLFFILR